MKLRYLLLCIVISGATFAQSRPKLDLQCFSIGKQLALECTARLKTANGDPINGAKLTLNAHMPSMPMAHSVKPAVAMATNQLGEYRGQLQLEMPGVWAILVDLSAPMRDRFIRRVQIEPCEKDKRCLALALSSKTSKP